MNGYIFFNGKKIAIQCENGEKISSLLEKTGIDLYMPCGKNGKCGKCKVKAFGAISEISSGERNLLTEDEIKSGVRLACYAEILGDFEIHVEAQAKMKISTDGILESFDLSPLSSLPFGIAIDIGTTTVAVYLCDLKLGKIIDVSSFANGQKIHGADVISRCKSIADDEKNLDILQNIIISQINDAISLLCERNNVQRQDIGAITVCANTVMEHIFAGINPKSISVYPFISPTFFGELYDMHEKFGLSEDAKIYLAPCIASYVGSDITAGIVATKLYESEKPVLFVDIGTNGEIAIGDKNGIYCCATAAGPAFEGSHIEKGMAGQSGAINKIYMEGSEIKYSVIDNASPKGICGSGIIDAVALMLDMGILDETGAICDIDEADDEYKKYVGERNDSNAFIIDQANDIYISQKDIREIQLAKSAIAAGINTLLKVSGKTALDIESVVISGGFGAYLSKESALKISMLNYEFKDKIIIGGNTAGMGAVAFLLSDTARQKASEIQKNAKYTELSENAFFMENYVEMMFFE